MLKKIVLVLLTCLATAASAAVDANKADQAQLESIKGVGASLSTRIMTERKNGPYKNWDDLISRVQGVGKGSAARLSKEGLTVNGAPYSDAVPQTKNDDKAAPKPAAPKAAPKP
ncbi:ComEA family DNA-binding protein [Caldimonas brevitalea]|uniref:Competence protein ComEA n=1 Tax=Caldimonas brevitalea TaxID=413882 RepID=A0A0G3BM06_9BURK|nr:helix-hairpin-helix domain-containing protein [Caldimonas brevitalea]AKJ30427.1 competence protein ComEA [Caldimonas brevitalea]